MRTMLAAVALVAVHWGCDAKASPTIPSPVKVDGPAYTARVKIDDVWGASCIDTLEACLGRVDGILSAKVLGRDRESKFYYNLQISETKAILPSTIRKMLADLKASSKGDDDFGYNSFELTSISGTVEKSGEAWKFTARGSNQKYDLVPNEALKKLVDGGKSQVTIAGKLTDDGGKLTVEISDAKETPK